LFDSEDYLVIGDYLFERSSKPSALGFRFIFFFYEALTIRCHVKIVRRDLKHITAKEILQLESETDTLPIWGNDYYTKVLKLKIVHTPMRGIPGQVQPFLRDTNGESIPQINVQKNETTVAVFGKSVTFDCNSLIIQVNRISIFTNWLGFTEP
jgi:hypothetical protein